MYLKHSTPAMVMWMVYYKTKSTRYIIILSCFRDSVIKYSSLSKHLPFHFQLSLTVSPRSRLTLRIFKAFFLETVHLFQAIDYRLVFWHSSSTIFIIKQRMVKQIVDEHWVNIACWEIHCRTTTNVIKFDCVHTAQTISKQCINDRIIKCKQKCWTNKFDHWLSLCYL